MIPTKLSTLLQWILSGVATELQTEKRTDEVNAKAVLLAQQIMYEVKTDRQRQTDYVPELALDVTKNSTSKSLPTSTIPEAELLPCHVPSNAQPKCPRYGRLDMSPSPDITNAAVQDDLAWSVGQSLARSHSENPNIPTWAAYNSKVSSSTLPLTTVAITSSACA
ncbi:hypothetical protein OS493_019412 [Desmophyllum pertusum]|uniref:Uncharacterized protein n=1 Tax=Desmophyllum pertusum TaxID=174260 RepID=A0A9X0A1B8_9CNID|nr:hypothetical protein OS493_019412 [Desmophyllum pertusum]